MPHRDWAGAAGTVPYRVQLDSGRKVLVHRDEPWLVRDLALQPEGPRQEEHDHQEDDGAGLLGCGHDHDHSEGEHCSHDHDHADRGHEQHQHVDEHVHVH